MKNDIWPAEAADPPPIDMREFAKRLISAGAALNYAGFLIPSGRYERVQWQALAGTLEQLAKLAPLVRDWIADEIDAQLRASEAGSALFSPSSAQR